MKVKLNLSLDEDIAAILKQLAKESHKTASQWVTDKVWEDKQNILDERMETAEYKSPVSN